jgi:GDP-4-dehydro-6-deoxy-D-mannose reductase
VRVLVTGASGFAGAHLCAELRGQGYEVATLGTDPYADYRVDVRARDEVLAAVEAACPVGVFHLAAIAFVPAAEADPLLTDEVNHVGTCNVLDAAAVTKARTLVVSSGAVYGRLAAADSPATEDRELRPEGAYAASKAAAEEACSRRAARQEIVRVRPFNQTGPGQPRQYVCSDFARQVARCEENPAGGRVEVGDLSAQRDFIDVRDAVRAYLLAWRDGRPGEVYNVCSGESVAVRTILDTLIELARVKVDVDVRGERLRPGEVSRFHGSAAKLERATGWRSRLSLRASLADLLDDWRQRVRDNPVGVDV